MEGTYITTRVAVKTAALMISRAPVWFADSTIRLVPPTMARSTPSPWLMALAIFFRRTPFELHGAFPPNPEDFAMRGRTCGCFLELNAQPKRLDLTDVHARMAKEEGVLVAINSDAHTVDDFGNLDNGIGQARRGWLEAADMLNTRAAGVVAATRLRLANPRAVAFLPRRRPVQIDRQPPSNACREADKHDMPLSLGTRF